MKGRTDEWIEQRVLWMLRKHRLPGGRTHLYVESDPTIPETVKDVARSGVMGRPIVVMSENAEQWTLLGTEAIASSELGRQIIVSLDDIAEITADDVVDIPKELLSHLRIRDEKDCIGMLWAPQGPEIFALWNILSNLMKMRKSRW